MTVTVKATTHLIAWCVAGFFSFLAVFISTRLIRAHLRHFTKPLIQSKIVGILWMVPIYAADSWLSLRFKDIALYLDMCRDCYEAYVIYLFLALMIAYLGDGDEQKVIKLLSNLPELSHPFPFSLFLPPMPMGKSFLKKCKMATMQFVGLKPLTTFAAIVLEANDLYDEGHFTPNRGYLYVTLIMNFSISYAFYYLVLFYLALGEHLKPFHPVPKFLCIKAILFLSFWQGVFLAFLTKFEIIHDVGSWTSRNVATGIQNLLICFEMCIAAIAHQYAFPYQPFQGGFSLRSSLLADHLSFKDAVRDFNEVMPVVLPSDFQPGPATSIDRSQVENEEFQELLQQFANDRLSDDEHSHQQSTLNQK